MNEWMSEWMKTCFYRPQVKFRWVKSSGSSFFKGLYWIEGSPVSLSFLPPNTSTTNIVFAQASTISRRVDPSELFFCLHSCLSEGRVKPSQTGQLTWRFSVKISKEKKMNCLELPRTKLYLPNATQQFTIFTSPSGKLSLRSLNCFLQGGWK